MMKGGHNMKTKIETLEAFCLRYKKRLSHGSNVIRNEKVMFLKLPDMM